MPELVAHPKYGPEVMIAKKDRDIEAMVKKRRASVKEYGIIETGGPIRWANCTQCNKEFNVTKNHEIACKWHPGK